MLALSVPAHATDAAAMPPPDFDLFGLLAVFVGGEAAAKWVAIIGLVAWVLTQVMAWVPPQWVARLPAWAIRLLKVLAGNYRRSANGMANDPEQLRRTL
ncbi:hypothetical protein KAM448_29470 [Aeromonas caviae]|uniref:hypothetical protein n=2 Tax=Gammaproteobacteria TaxID=1236 RepID=UPI00195380F7|nr:hypothetical protein [Citrobacter freundii]GJB12939.1 hypothetical protein KAM362_34990 [Aeromonas caviae]GJB25576.1 hypothetical protein KAM365_33260 [Aeromonas caviae]GJB34351.1 hypothetical protein KAM367_34530 [Aeromonas caviae]GKQ80653.1 hypothetical protein KAM448_29470 [Aeromonas caviae]